MSRVEQLEQSIRALTDREFADFRAWFADFDAAIWDKQIEADVAAGRLNDAADEAIRDLQKGACTDL